MKAKTHAVLPHFAYFSQSILKIFNFYLQQHKKFRRIS